MKESNVRNLTKTLAVLSLLAPAGAHPLGIGGIKLHSALNQNLNAEIPLVLSQGEKIADIKIHLAPPDKFDEAGVPWNSFLSKIKFEPVVRSDGSVIIRVSSREALKEPFLGLLLEVSWPKGSLYREFSVLVDPPEVYAQPTVPVVRLPEQLSQAPSLSADQRVEARPMPTTAARSVSPVSDHYGPTSRNDTLWKIAERAGRQRKVSVEQMMIATYRENPHAFFKENINALSLGKTLKLPEREAVLKLSRKEALAEYRRHAESWKSQIVREPEKIEVAAVKEEAAKESREVKSQLNLEAPSEATVLENAVISPGQSEPGKETQVSQSATGDGAQAESSQGLADLQRKMQEMQEQLAKMQELIALKDQQLAALQQQAVAQPQTQIPVPPLTQTGAQSAEEPAVRRLDSETAQSASRTAPETESAKAEVKPKVKTAVRPKPAPLPETETEPDSFYLSIGTFGVGLLATLGWLWWRKRKIDAKTDTESMFAPTIVTRPIQESVKTREPAADTQLTDESSFYNVEPVGESSFLSEFTPSDFDAFDTDQGEIDPVSEADVYLAYGRYQQAEELMRQAIIDQPDRDECKLKLLEIFYANEDSDGFEAYAGELAAAGKKDDPVFWDKVTEMGKEVCQNSALFRSGSGRTPGRGDKQAGNASVSLDKMQNDPPADFDVSDVMEFGGASFDSLKHDESLPDSGEAGSGEFNFDINLDADEQKTDKDEDYRNNETMEFDLDSVVQFNSGETSLRAGENKADDQSGLHESTTDFDFESFDFNLESAPSGSKGIGLTASAAQEERKEGFSFDDDFGFDVSGDGAGEEHDDLFAVSDLTDMDEFETKLDLARAYMDMGDEVSAKEIVEQVLEKGSDDQKKVAQKIIDHLA
ncbi:MAG: FimV/HubP family polar landmark protein [Gammaproteobacteria bacterium]